MYKMEVNTDMLHLIGRHYGYGNQPGLRHVLHFNWKKVK
jgi:hypothetical protein